MEVLCLFKWLTVGVLSFHDLSTCAAGLMRHTFASAIKIFKLGIERLFHGLGVQFRCQSTCRPDLGLYVKHWSTHVGWPECVENAVSNVIRGWFERPYIEGPAI